MRLALALSLVIAGCIAPNPDYVGGGGDVGGGGAGSGGGGGGAGGGGAGGTGGGGGGGTGGGSTAPDLSMVEPPDLGAPPDLTPPPPVCKDGTRECFGTTAVVCDHGQWTSGRPCPYATNPSTASCTGGYCDSPAGAPNCLFGSGPSETYCYQQVSQNASCEPFVDPQSMGLFWSCAQSVGKGASGDACTNGSQCRTGLCGANGTCFRSCTGASDCPQHTPALKCKSVGIEVEGVSMTENSCVP
jgi:hypothetical protein